MWMILLVLVTLFVNCIQIKLVSKNTKRCHGKPPSKSVAKDKKIKHDRNKLIAIKGKNEKEFKSNWS